MNALIFAELFLFSLGLAADAFAVSVCRGLSAGRVTTGQILTVGVWFGGFQALMPALGYFLGEYARELIEDYDHWIAFILLFAIGANMIRESFSSEPEKNADASFSFFSMLVLAVATSIDALAVGIAMAMSHRYEIAPASAMIGAVTFVLSGLGLKIGSVFGEKYKKPATVAGGVILISLGVFILGEHLWW